MMANYYFKEYVLIKKRISLVSCSSVALLLLSGATAFQKANMILLLRNVDAAVAERDKITGGLRFAQKKKLLVGSKLTDTEKATHKLMRRQSA
jgi:hypothetical protein